MSLIANLLLAIGLGMDAMAVSVSSGANIRPFRIDNALKMSIFFGGFQAAMPLIGWFAGSSIDHLISDYDHWIAFGLLLLIGLKMIYESFSQEDENISSLGIYVLLMLSIATSIDALAVGISFAFLKSSILTPVIIIGIVTFLMSLCGAFIGNRIGHMFENKMEILGGIILIGIGFNILVEHLLQI